jgi:type IV pilus assembly protein PilB
MTTNELVKIVAKKTGLEEAKITRALQSFQSIIGTELNSGGEVQIPGFGNFVLVNYPSRTVANPHDRSKKIVTFGSNVPKFRPHPELNQAISSAKLNESLPNDSAADYIAYEDLSKYSVPKKVLALVPEHIARHYQIVPLRELGTKLVVAMIDPEDREAIDFVKKRTGKELELKICTQADLNHILDQYAGVSGELKKIVEKVEKEEGTQGKEDTKATESSEEITESAPAAKIVQSLIKRAVREKASDIHIEPTEEQVIVRFRVDGILQKIITLPIDVLPSIVSRIKIMSGMKIDETRLPQDGRFQTVSDQNEIDFRVSTFPTVNGEKVVARILDKTTGILTLEQLGFRGSAFEILGQNITKPHGMILVTGPTGSGKTTTLYAVLQKLMSETVNIVTLEDPVEYRIPSINQGQVYSSIGFTFANGLRSILRQDPDIIMIGEIRDHETADMSIHSALTGHIVLSTLHTNDAAGAIPRFIDMGIEPFLINSSLNVVVGQRLCRKICENCKEEVEIDKANLDIVDSEIKRLPEKEKRPDKIRFFHGKGCENCHNTGYTGRVGIFEVFNLTNDMKNLVAKKASGTELLEIALKNGMITMRQDGILKAIDGITTLEEVWRVTKE